VLVFAVTAVTGLTTPASATDRYVATNGLNTAGTNWATAFRTVQQGLDAAVGGETVFVAGHTFNLTNEIAWTKSYVAVRGGYEGAVPAGPGTNNPARWPTVLIRKTGNCRVMSVNGATEGTLYGVTIAGGYLSGADPICYGGGLRILNCTTFTLAESRVTNNWVICTSSAKAMGGGLYASNSSVVVSNCLVQDNWTYGQYYYAVGYGGGLSAIGGSMVVQDCVVANNHARGEMKGSYWQYGYGGGIYVNGGTLQVRNSLVVANNSPNCDNPVGHGICVAAGSAQVQNCTVTANAGEGIRRAGGNVSVANSIVWANGDDLANFGTNALGLLTNVTYSCIEDGDNAGTNWCISGNPLFVYGAYLATNSPCVNAGGSSAAAAGLDAYCTRADGVKDTGTVDLGYHQKVGMDLSVADLYVTTNGSDLNTGTNWIQALTTITRALAKSRMGSRIHIGVGAYGRTKETFPLRMNKVGLQLIGSGATGTVVNASGSGKNAILVDGVGGSGRIEGMTITGGYATNVLDVGQYGFGGGINIRNSTLCLASCRVTNNWAVAGPQYNYVPTHGGGLYAQDSSVIVTNCEIARNTAYGWGAGNRSYGAGISVANSSLEMRDTILANNISRANPGYGSSANGGGIYVNGGTSRLRNCLVSGNSCYYADYKYAFGIGMQVGQLRLENCTVNANGSEGIRRWAGTVAVSNSIVWANGDDLYGFATNGAGVLTGLSYSCVEDGDNAATNWCIRSNPRFEYGVYLVTNSPCLDAGGAAAGAIGLGGYGTRADGVKDTGNVDLGYHQRAGMSLSAADLYVTTNGSDLNTGTNWVQALATITKALSASRMGTRIHIGAGRFTRTKETFPLRMDKVGLQLIGSGSTGTVVDASASGKNVILVDGVGGSGRIEGMTITGGYATNVLEVAQYGFGGGLNVRNSTLCIASCRLSNNWAVAGTQYNYVPTHGGGLYAQDSSVMVTNCEIRSNTTYGWGSGNRSYGAGVAITDGEVELRDTMVADNVSRAMLGYNSSASGGGVYISGGRHLLRNSLISGNSCFYADYKNAHGIGVQAGVVRLQNCTVTANGMEGIRRWGGTVSLSNCIAWANGDDLIGFVTNGAGLLTSVFYSCIEDGDNEGLNGCIAGDPQFEFGVFLATNSASVNAGGTSAAAVGLDGYGTRADGVKDTGTVDLGYHQRVGVSLAAADLYVTTNGSDLNSGTNWIQALASITKALAKSQMGTRIHIGAGTFNKTNEAFPLRMEKMGLQLLGAGMTTTVIDAWGSGKNAILVDGVGGNGRIEALTITGGYATNVLEVEQYGYGGGLNIKDSALKIVSCLISSNWAVGPMPHAYKPTQGGGLYAQDSHVVVTNCIIRQNTAYGWGYGIRTYGAGIAVANGTLEMFETVVAGNTSRSTMGYGSQASGGGLYANGGTHWLKNCLLADNVCSNADYRYAHGVEVQAGSLLLENCTVTGGGAEGVRRWTGTLAVSNSIVWWPAGNDFANMATNVAGALTQVFYTCIEDNDNPGINGCFTANPLFVDTNYYHLKSRAGNYVGGYFSGGHWSLSKNNSPCIDTGNPDADYANEPRPNDYHVNLGAYGNTRVASRSYTPGTMMVVR